MSRYKLDPFFDIIDDNGTGEHSADDLREILLILRGRGRSVRDLIKILMKYLRITEAEAAELVAAALGDDYEDDREMNDDPNP